MDQTSAMHYCKKKYADKCILLDNFGGYMNPIKDSFIDFRKQRFPSLKNIIIERCDTSNYKALSSILNKYKPNYIYTCSGTWAF